MIGEPLDALRREQVMNSLAAVPDLLVELDITLSRGAAIGGDRVSGSGRGGAHHRPMPYHQGASDAHAVLARTLRHYARRVGVLVQAPFESTPRAAAAFLRARLPRIPDDAPALAGIHPALPAAVDAVRAAIDRPVERVCIGLCDCGTRLYALEGQILVRCSGCTGEYSVAERRAFLLAQARDMVGTAVELARILPWFSGKPITAAIIRQWAARGKLSGRAVAGETVYRVGDVLNLHLAEQK